MERRAIAIYGTVQGVGFRPFVHNLASQLALDGFIKNQAGGVEIEVEGESEPLDQFLEQLVKSPPPLARIEEIHWERRSPNGQPGFAIQPSEAGIGPVAISPDAAVCPDCLAEMFDPSNRRYRYPFINCTHCGPRLTIVRSAPYDRERTTMAAFEMCPACRAEYDNPRNRRFHAQPIACPKCGPQLYLLNSTGQSIESPDPLNEFAQAIMTGQIGALKGIGGYHLVCDATNPDAIRTLRHRKSRDEKPFAVMVPNLESARAICEISPAEESLLTSPASPIVLLRKCGFPPSPGTSGEGRGEGNSQHSTNAVIPGLVESRLLNASDVGWAMPTTKNGRQSPPYESCSSAFSVQRSALNLISPHNANIGLMLPYSPLHHLLMHAVQRPLIMTSGNRSDEPIAYEDADAIHALNGIADVFLSHNRPIHIRCDDSVTRCIAGAESPIRRSRGYAPHSIPLPLQCPAPILATGGQLKGAFAIGQNSRAILSQHMGDLDHYSAYTAFARDITLYEKLFSITPKCIAHDLHPDYSSTRYALSRNLPCIAVQHHHAHIAACMVEHGLIEKVIGVAFDGSGFGTDGAIWGGEFLIADYSAFRRAGHFRYVPLPGGEQAVREPWRCALARLTEANAHCRQFESRQSESALRTVRTMMEKKLNCPLTSSVGRLFDAVASLCGIRDTVSYEGQAAMELESLAATVEPDVTYPFRISAALQIETRPMIRSIAGEVDAHIEPAKIARRFHSTLANIIVAICRRLRTAEHIHTVVLSGGVFMNALLSTETEHQLTNAGFTVYYHRKVPPNDAGLCLGQLAIAAAQLTNSNSPYFQAKPGRPRPNLHN